MLSKRKNMIVNSPLNDNDHLHNTSNLLRNESDTAGIEKLSAEMPARVPELFMYFPDTPSLA